MQYKPHTRLVLTEQNHSEEYVQAYRLSQRYLELKNKYKELSCIGVASPSLSSFGSRTTKQGSSIENLAIKLAELGEKIAILETTALEIAGDEKVASALIQNLGEHKPYNSVYPMPPISRSRFYILRTRYLNRVAEKMKTTGGDSNE